MDSGLDNTLDEMRENAKRVFAETTHIGKNVEAIYFQFETWFDVECYDSFSHLCLYRWDIDRQCWYHWENIYVKISLEKWDGVIIKWADQHGVKTSGQMMGHITTRIKARDNVMIHSADFDMDKTQFACQNGVVDLVKKIIKPFSPNILTTFMFPFEFHELPGETPIIDMLRNKYFDGMRFIEQFINSTLRRDHTQEYELTILGSTNTGKSTILDVITKGFEPVRAFATHRELDGPHGLYVLVGSWLNIDTDAAMDVMGHDATAVKKKLIGGDRLQVVNQKKKDQYTYFFQTHFMKATNQLPRLPGVVDRKAFFRRQLIIQFNIMEEKPDPNIKINVVKELSDWMSEIILMPYIPNYPFLGDLEDHINRTSQIWEESSNPIRRLCRTIFERDVKGMNQLDIEDVLDMIREKLSEEDRTPPPSNSLKEWVITEMSKMRIRRKTAKYISYFYPVKVKQEFEDFAKGIILNPKESKQKEEPKKKKITEKNVLDEIVFTP